ncbi:SMP-30/gluconolactonase/LRE family protein [Colwellia echini]|uniref:SMP-30/gluconolactonase/LRE family protein n=1 Tax=Colwellia echini TaxID=1982103 RepID=A0ABY3N145_9GAMM|nr:SMP-30/gluconolactonase/LRE family protein [Colwellia echini]TYK67221.1 SMP-30/gluconolactonase/LRE family protein [Colwellia echini]
MFKSIKNVKEISIIGGFALILLGGCAQERSINTSNPSLTSNTDTSTEKVGGNHNPLAKVTSQYKTLGSIEIINNSAKAYLDASSKVVEIATGFKWTEGPLWLNKSDTLIFSDIPDNKIYQYNEKSGLSVYLNKTGATDLVEGDYLGGSNALLLNQSDQLVLLQTGDRRVSIMNAPLDQPQSLFSTLAGAYQGLRLNSPNDGVFDQQGNLYFSDPAYGLKDKLDDERKELTFQGVYRLTPWGKLSVIDETIKFPNGIGISPDNKTLYVAVSDEQAPVWFAYDIEDDGSVVNKQLLHDASTNKLDNDIGVPDGMAVHSSGVIFATAPGGVWLLSANGELLAKINTGKFSANCALSADEKQLFITAHDSILKVDLN